MKIQVILVACLSLSSGVFAQSQKPDLRDQNLWKVVNRNASFTEENGKAVIKLDEVEGDGMALVKSSDFSVGTIEFDVKGRNAPQQSFVGLSFHVSDDRTYEAIYFRPFNFMNADTARRYRSVQYIFMPSHPWEKLRADTPGKYENKVNPVPDPDGWFHVKAVVTEKNVTVFVNNSTRSSLSVERLGTRQGGLIGLWVGNNSGASFSNLNISGSK